MNAIQDYGYLEGMSIRGRTVIGWDSPVPGHIDCLAFSPIYAFTTPQILTGAHNGAEEGEIHLLHRRGTFMAEGTSLTDRGSEVCGVHAADSPQRPPSNVDGHSPNMSSQTRLNATRTGIQRLMDITRSSPTPSQLRSWWCRSDCGLVWEGGKPDVLAEKSIERSKANEASETNKQRRERSSRTSGMLQTMESRMKIAVDVHKRPCLGPAFEDFVAVTHISPPKNQLVKIADQITGSPNHQYSR